MKKCQARVEFLAVKNEVSDLLCKGYSVFYIYSVLKEERKISMSYRSMLYYVNGRISKRRLKDDKMTVTNKKEMISDHSIQHKSAGIEKKDRRFVMPQE